MDGARVTDFSFSPCERLLAVGFWGDAYAIFETVCRRARVPGALFNLPVCIYVRIPCACANPLCASQFACMHQAGPFQTQTSK